MRVSSLALLLVVTAAGCSWGVPGVDDVKRNMAPEQLALGEPIVNSVGMVMVPIPAGRFLMGAVDRSWEEQYKKALQDPIVKEMLQKGQITKEVLMERVKQSAQQRGGRRKFGPEEPQHVVKITRPFYLSACEVTQQQYEEVMDARPWEGKPLVREGADYAASYVTWNDAVEFCRRLSERENQTYRLPTEAEWEYACRAGTTTRWSFGDDAKSLDEYAWYEANAYQAGRQYPHRVGGRLPNPWALYDMHGNLWEWCSDWYAPYDPRIKEAVDPSGPEKGRHHVWRGGSFADPPQNTRSATRLSYGREDYHPDYLTGFRVVRQMQPKQ